MVIKEWITNPANRGKVTIGGVILLLIIGFLVMWYGIDKFTNWLHDINYNAQQTADKDAANKAEANANKHETNANTAENQQKELEKDEQNINNQRTEQNKIIATDKEGSKATRDRLDKALHKSPANRAGGDGLSDDQLRADSDRAAADFNTNRTTPTPTPEH